MKNIFIHMYQIYHTLVYKALIDIYLTYPTSVQKALTENDTENHTK